MKVFVSPSPKWGGNLRDALLRNSLIAYVTRMAPSTYPEVKAIVDEEHTLNTISSIGHLSTSRHAKAALFIGLCNAPEHMLGNNFLVLTRGLDQELYDFGRRNGLTSPRDDVHSKNVLRTFKAAILTERSAVSASVGFAPWISLRLADRFPVILKKGETIDSLPRTLIIDHGHGPATLRTTLEMIARQEGPLSVITSSDVFTPEIADALNYSIHIHFGYSDCSPPTALTPLDSMMNGAYTLVVPRELNGPHEAGQVLMQEAQRRSYVVIAETNTTALRVLPAFLERAGVVFRQKLSFNPEIRRFEQINERYLANCLKQFDERVME